MASNSKKKILLVALGGNALIRKGQAGTIDEQFENLRTPMEQVARLSRDFRIILTHGNGPQVGNLMLQQECCDAVPGLPLEILVAQTQGQIGYMIESTLDAALMALGVEDQLFVSLLSYVVVDPDDPAFADPAKPVGPVFTEEQAARLSYPTRQTAKGRRRVVASPKPATIVEKREIRRLIEAGFLVICCGGGGIPVIREGRSFAGVDAVIDKDLASARLAAEVGVDRFLIATDEPGAFLDYGKPDQRFLSEMTVEEAEGHLEAGQFPPGSMGPKIEAAVAFVKSGGREAVIASVDRIGEAVAGKTGTRIVTGG
ncbi:MAG: carbamate kinase [Desulfococcaceae bacterium]